MCDWSQAKNGVPNCGVLEQLELINILHWEPSRGTEEKWTLFAGTEWRLSVRCVFRQQLWLVAGTPCWECSLSEGRCSWKLKRRWAADRVMMECPALIYSFMFVQSFISNGKLILIQNETCGKGQIRFSDTTANIFLFLLLSALGHFWPLLLKMVWLVNLRKQAGNRQTCVQGDELKK